MENNFFIPTKLFFGNGCINKLDKVKGLGKFAMIVTSGVSTSKLGYISQIQSILNTINVQSAVYAGVVPNPTLKNVETIVEMIKDNRCDFVIGIGGGSAIDAAKAAAFMATNPGELWDYASSGSGKKKGEKKKALPIVAIPTTSGTGTEMDQFFVITNEQLNEKIGFGFESTFPRIAIVDPTLSFSVPPQLTAFQGFDALFHSIEGTVSNCSSVFSEPYAIKAISYITRYLPLAVRDGQDRNARGFVSLASTFSGMVETLSSCMSQHSIEHAMSALHPELPHGAGLIMISKAYFKRFLDAAPAKLVRLAKIMGIKTAVKSADFITALDNLIKDCHVDDLKMSDYGITKDEFETIADNALFAMSTLFKNDPRKLTKKDIVQILSESYR